MRDVRRCAGAKRGRGSGRHHVGSMADRPKRVTLATVAERVGLSVMTVSNAYNHPSRVAAEQRVRIMDAAAELGYTGPHPVARSLRRGRVGSLGVLVGSDLAYAFDDPGAV